MARTLSAGEAADRLGVKLATVYAYASRGYLTSERGTDGRRSYFDATEVDRLARRGRPRRSTRGPTIDITIASGITVIDPLRGPAYRGRLATDLADTASFEQVAELLWTGNLPPLQPRWPEPVALWDPDSGAPIERLGVLVAELAARTGGEEGTGAGAHGGAGPASIAPAERELITSVVAGLSPRWERVPRLRLDGRAPLRGTVAGQLTVRLMERRPPVGAAEAVNAALVLLADHELASSTLAARVAASTRAGPGAAVSAGLGACAGPLHGNASVHARALLDDALAMGPARAIADHVADRGVLAGFGHPLYRHGDPRAAALSDQLRARCGDHRVLRVTDEMAERSQDQGQGRPNIDLTLAALTRVLGMEPDAGPAIFAVARMAGWLAHVAEEYAERPLRYRVRAAARRS